MHTLVLLRHGQSTWNLENRFTGWTDVDLTPQGHEEARSAATLLAERGYTFDVAYTSVLKRAIRTLWIVQDGMDLMWIPVHRDWRLNERHYGALQGLNKAETAEKFGEAQVKTWRRSYAIPPPALEPLADTVKRFLPAWHATIAPAVKSGKRVLVAAHGNSLRALVKYLDGMSDEAVVELNIPTGIPLVYELDTGLKPIRHYYLGDPEAVQKAAEAVARQGRKSS